MLQDVCPRQLSWLFWQADESPLYKQGVISSILVCDNSEIDEPSLNPTVSCCWYVWYKNQAASQQLPSRHELHGGAVRVERCSNVCHKFNVHVTPTTPDFKAQQNPIPMNWSSYSFPAQMFPQESNWPSYWTLVLESSHNHIASESQAGKRSSLRKYAAHDFCFFLSVPLYQVVRSLSPAWLLCMCIEE